MSAESRHIGGHRPPLQQESQLPNPKTATQEDIPPDRTKALPRVFLFFLCGMIFLLRRVEYASSLRKPLLQCNPSAYHRYAYIHCFCVLF